MNQYLIKNSAGRVWAYSSETCTMEHIRRYAGILNTRNKEGLEYWWGGIQSSEDTMLPTIEEPPIFKEN